MLKEQIDVDSKETRKSVIEHDADENLLEEIS